MLSSLHRFTRLLRAAGIRVSSVEVVDAARCVAAPGIIGDRTTFGAALRASLVKDIRDRERFDELFDAYFALVNFNEDGAAAREDGAAAEPTSTLGDFTIADELGQRPPRADMESPDAEVGDLFDRENLIERYSPHPELNPIVLDNDTDDEVVFSAQDVASVEDSASIVLDVDHTHGIAPGQLSTTSGRPVDASLSLAEQDALLDWLSGAADPIPPASADDGDEGDAAELRTMLERLPEALRKHIEYLMSIERTVADTARAEADDVAEHEELEESLRRIIATVRGAITHRKREAARGRIDSARTMRRNMRYDGVPFRPVTVSRAEDKPRLIVLTDVSLSVRAAARFTLRLVHGLHELFAQVRSYAFVADVAEVTGLFDQARIVDAIGSLFAGDVFDVDANSDYGTVFERFLDEHASAITRRTTLLVLGDGRGNGNDPNVSTFAEITRRARETIWLTPEPRYSWGLGGCDLPSYAEHCDRVRVVRDLGGLERAAQEMTAEMARR